MTLKLNRSNKYTRGLVVTMHDNPYRFFFFELDLNWQGYAFGRVKQTYINHGLDLLIHRTGAGWHFLSPTLISKDEWKAFHQELKDLNKKCPMTTLRIEPNKYPDEKDIWYICDYFYCRFHDRPNSIELSQLLNKWFETKFEGTLKTDLKLVRYPLP